MRKYFAIVAFAVALVGCAGTPFKWDDARKLHEGMTEQEATTVMGPPYLVKTSADGLVYVWSYGNGFGQARSVSVVFKEGKIVKAPVIPEAFK